jgi:hypothetical protein
MKHIATVAVMLTLGVAGAYAQGRGHHQDHERPIKMSFSGTNVATTINLQPDTVTDETQLEGTGTLGAFTFRELHADGRAPEPVAGCSGPSFLVVAGGGVFRFQDGSLLTVTVMDGSGCIFARNAVLTVNYAITGGTGRFTGAGGKLTMTGTIAVVFRNASMAPALLINTGEFEGTLINDN